MSDELVTIATFLNIGEAKLAQGKLSSAGIDASVRDENAMNLHIGMAMWGIKLQVPDHQVVRALEVLDDFRDSEGAKTKTRPTTVVPCCPECESLEIRQVAGANPRQISLWSSAIPFPEASSRAKAALALPGLRLPVGEKTKNTGRLMLSSGRSACENRISSPNCHDSNRFRETDATAPAEITPQLLRDHGITPEEYERILKSLGRDADAHRVGHLSA